MSSHSGKQVQEQNEIVESFDFRKFFCSGPIFDRSKVPSSSRLTP